MADIATVSNGPKSLRARKKQQTHDDLVRAAVELFESQGYDATSVDEIADRANYSRATFFRYFRTKEEAVFLDLDDGLLRFSDRLRNPLPGEIPLQTAENALSEHMVRTFATPRMVTDDRGRNYDLQRACVRLWLAEPTLARRYASVVSEWEAELARFFQETLDGDATLEARVLAMIVVSVGRAVTEQHLSTEEDVPTLVRRGYAAARELLAT